MPRPQPHPADRRERRMVRGWVQAGLHDAFEAEIADVLATLDPDAPALAALRSTRERLAVVAQEVDLDRWRAHAIAGGIAFHRTWPDRCLITYHEDTGRIAVSSATLDASEGPLDLEAAVDTAAPAALRQLREAPPSSRWAASCLADLFALRTHRWPSTPS